MTYRRITLLFAVLFSAGMVPTSFAGDDAQAMSPLENHAGMKHGNEWKVGHNAASANVNAE